MKTTVQMLDELLSQVKRYDPVIEGGCECCGTWAGLEEYKNGEVVKYDELLALVNKLKAELTK